MIVYHGTKTVIHLFFKGSPMGEIQTGGDVRAGPHVDDGIADQQGWWRRPAVDAISPAGRWGGCRISSNSLHASIVGSSFSSDETPKS